MMPIHLIVVDSSMLKIVISSNKFIMHYITMIFPLNCIDQMHHAWFLMNCSDIFFTINEEITHEIWFSGHCPQTPTEVGAPCMSLPTRAP